MLFADDAKLYSTINDEQDCLNLQADLDSLVNWSKDWLINFNKKKCVVLRLKRSIDFDYYIEDHKLLEVTEQADLGIIISNDLKPSKHIAKDKVASKANQRLGMIRRCFSNHCSGIIKPLYQAIVRPIIEYNSPVWNPWLLKDIQELDKVQKRCLKLCSTNIDLEPLSRRRDRADLVLVLVDTQQSSQRSITRDIETTEWKVNKSCIDLKQYHQHYGLFTKAREEVRTTGSQEVLLLQQSYIQE